MGNGGERAPTFLRGYTEDCPRENTEDESAAAPLKTGKYVLDHDPNSAEDCERVSSNVGNGFEALATPPMEFTTKVPDDWEVGKTVRIQGPHGPLEIEAPKE